MKKTPTENELTVEKTGDEISPEDLKYLQKHEMGRRDFLMDTLALGGLAATFGLTASASAWANIQPPDDEILRIGYLPITDATVLLVAHAKGFFEEEGIKAERPTLIRGWSPLIEGFAAGKFNLVHFLKPIPIWMRYNNGFPVKIMSWAHLNGSGLVVGRHTDVSSFAELGGKQVAVPYWYSMHNIVLQMALRNVGLKPVIKGYGEVLASTRLICKSCPHQICPLHSLRKKSTPSSSRNRSTQPESCLPEERCCVSPGISGATTHAVSFV